MSKKNDKRPAHELRDRPVPPVKGAVSVPQDIVTHPDAALQQGILSGPQAVTEPENWL